MFPIIGFSAIGCIEMNGDETLRCGPANWVSQFAAAVFAAWFGTSSNDGILDHLAAITINWSIEECHGSLFSI